MKTNGNDPITSGVLKIDGGEIFMAGLTKREHFAAIALQGYIAAGSTGMPDEQTLANLSVLAADAFIKALNK